MLASLSKKLGVNQLTLLTIIIAALGYFVDVFDLILFSVVRVKSLKDLGVAEADLLSTGLLLLNFQMAGFLIGGVIWGIWGDKKGRVSVLFGSILLYSLANVANGFAQDISQYAVLRFIAGVGLAGELGAGVTLASELLPKKWRGLGTTFIATVGMLGAICAALIAGELVWRSAYMIGGALGIVLLVLRMHVHESDMFKAVKAKAVVRGNILMLLRGDLLKKYIAVILVGAPIWGSVGLLVTFAPEFAKDIGASFIPVVGTVVLYYYFGLTVGDAISGLLSQYLKSRRLALAIFLVLSSVCVALYLFVPAPSALAFYLVCFALGTANGYWCMFIQVGAEQFGTNIRSTAATSIPNMVRGSTVIAAASFHALTPALGIQMSGFLVLSVIMALALGALWSLKDTFHADLDYIET